MRTVRTVFVPFDRFGTRPMPFSVQTFAFASSEPS